MATSTRQEVRQQLLDLDLVDGIYGTATAGAGDSVTDTDLLQFEGQSRARFANRWLYRPNAANAADYLRRIALTGFAPDDGRIDHMGGDYTENPLAGGEDGYYEVWPWDPRMVNRAFSRALTERIFQIQQDDIVTNGQNRYDVTAAPFSLSIESPQNQILQIYQVHGTEPNATLEQWDKGGRTWRPMLDNGTLYLWFDPAPTGTIRIEWKENEADITDETTTTTADRTWLVWATLTEMFGMLAAAASRRNEDNTELLELRRQAYNRYWGRRQMFMSQYGSQVITPKPRWVSGVASPRMGRGSSSRLGGSGGRTITAP